MKWNIMQLVQKMGLLKLNGSRMKCLHWMSNKNIVLKFEILYISSSKPIWILLYQEILEKGIKLDVIIKD